jgi:hypothetical protein
MSLIIVLLSASVQINSLSVDAKKELHKISQARGLSIEEENELQKTLECLELSLQRYRKVYYINVISLGENKKVVVQILQDVFNNKEITEFSIPLWLAAWAQIPLQEQDAFTIKQALGKIGARVIFTEA